MHDLIGGRATWTAFGLPTEGSVGDRRRIAGHVQPAATVTATGTVGDLPAGARHVAVVDDRGVLVGAVDSRTTASLPAATPLRGLMVPAPATIRPELRIDEVVTRLRDDSLDHVFVTTIAGVLLGIVHTDALHV